MIGVFDSGFGGLSVLKPIHDRLPHYSTIYLGDNARAPYGVRSEKEIFEFTLQGVRFLLKKGCPLVVIACNTASAQALRRIQQEILPIEFPDRRVLGVIRPAVEYLAKNNKRVGIFATHAAVESQAYIHELYKLRPEMKVSQIACPGLVDLIEKGEQTSDLADKLVKKCVQKLLIQDPQVDGALLGCTHYPLVSSLFRAHLPTEIHLLIQGDITAVSLASYLERHPELDQQLKKTAERIYFTTNHDDLSGLASVFYGKDILFQQTNI
ncbi:MAG: glutamate racemase [Lentisphaerae bacterium GWF2_44_16]|nr:MAG: glutamate racemase [Lentisphaerae bacterium GWF2_44_16]HAU65834.1 glutamate racemase [Candidatus Uhrbacteria bacterium]